MMTKVHAKLVKLLKKEEGASLVEYGLLVALIAVVCIAGVTALGGSLNTMFTNLGTTIGNVSTGGSGGSGS